MSKREILAGLAVLTLAALACNPSGARPTVAPPPPPTVTPFQPQQQVTPQLPSPAAPTPGGGATPTSEQASPTPQPTNTVAPPPPTAQPTTQPSAGPLDFEPPRWVESWEPYNGQYRIWLRVRITGGAPPFKVIHQQQVVEEATWEREPVIPVIVAQCTGIPANITVESADGQSVSKDYWIGEDQLPWCVTPSP